MALPGSKWASKCEKRIKCLVSIHLHCTSLCPDDVLLPVESLVFSQMPGTSQCSMYVYIYIFSPTSEGGLVVKNLSANAGDARLWFDPWVGKIYWRKKWQPTPLVFLLEKSQRQRSLAGYSPWGHRVGHALAQHTVNAELLRIIPQLSSLGNVSKMIVMLYWSCLLTKSCLTLCNPMDCNPPGSSVQGIFQARILE